MNTCDLEETKHQALLKFEELCKEPDKWKNDSQRYYISCGRRWPDICCENYSIFFQDPIFEIVCGGFSLVRMKSSLKKTHANKYYKLAKGLIDHRTCTRLMYAMKTPVEAEPFKVEELPEPIKPTLWSKFKTWMKAN